MTLTTEEVTQLKQQLYEQIQQLPEDKRAIAKKQIDEMSAETLEYMLKQQSSQSNKNNEKNIFRMIADKEVESIIVGENKKAIAVLDINPISPAHTIIIPKSPVKDSKNMPNEVFTLAKAISKRIINIQKAKSTEIHSENKLGECIIHILPVYDSPVHLGSPRQKMPKEEIEVIGNKIKVRKRQRIPKVKIPKVLPHPEITKRRIP